MKKQIIGIGGGGMSKNIANHLILEKYLIICTIN